MESNFDPKIVGAIEVGTVLSVLLLGVFWTQLFYYYDRFPKDPLVVRAVVAIIWLASVAQSCCNVAGLYSLTILSFGRIPDVPKAHPIGTMFSALVQALVQLIYLNRMYKFSGRLVIPVLCAVVTTFNFVGTLIFRLDGLKITKISDTVAQRRHWEWLIFSVYGSTAVLDVVIAGVISYYLLKRRQAAMAATSHLVDTLIRWTLETGLITTMFAVAVIATFAVNKDNNIWLAIYIIMTNVYAITLLALLNRRSTLRTSGAMVNSLRADNFITSVDFDQPHDSRMDMVKVEVVRHQYTV